MQLTNHKNKFAASHRPISNACFGAVSNGLNQSSSPPLAEPERPGSFNGKENSVGSVEFRVVICSDDSEFEGVLSRFDAVQSCFIALEHTDQLSIDIGMDMLAALAFGELELQRHLIAPDDLVGFG